MEPGDLGLEQSFRDAPTLRHPQVSCNVKQACDVIFGGSEVDQTSRSRLVMARCFGLVTLGFRIYRMAIAVCVVAVYPHYVVASLTLELRTHVLLCLNAHGKSHPPICGGFGWAPSCSRAIAICVDRF
jgi:hypothetical protein